jgi:hypothetical protein
MNYQHLWKIQYAIRLVRASWSFLKATRLEGDQFLMTQELISNMLGVRCEEVTEAALKLQKADVITYARGRITVLDRVKLEVLGCECYAVVKKQYERLLPAQPAA